MAGLAQQIEATFLAVLEKADVERYNMLKVQQDLLVARAGVVLHTLRVTEAQDDVKRTQFQQRHAQLNLDRQRQMVGAIEADSSQREEMDRFENELHRQAAQPTDHASSPFNVLSYGTGKFHGDELLKEALAQQDVILGAQQLIIAQDQVQMARQESVIAGIQVNNAAAAVDFLSNKFTNADLYDWMSNVLQGVYSFFLQQATAIAQLAAHQLAFERQALPPPFIQADYWQAPTDGLDSDSKVPDRRGLTGSARLLQDIYQLDQYAFDTNQRKLQLTKTVSLAQLDPLAFQRFRETSVLPFATPMELFDRDFPGHYLRLIRRVRMSVVALIPPSQGIRATLMTTGTSRVVIGNDRFQTVRVHRGPDQVAFSSTQNATGPFELDQQPEMLLPFEGMGVDAYWELRMPKAANQFDYRTLADVLFTIEYTALHSFDYQQQVLQTLRPTLSTDRPFSFRQQFADQWYDLHNPDQTATPMTVRFTTVRDDFMPNLDALQIRHVGLYFARANGQSFEVPVTALRFTEDGNSGTVGGGAVSVDGIISTRRGNAESWTAMIGKTPFGAWELALPNTKEMRSRFKDEDLEEILFVITYTGRTPAWPM